MKMTYSSASRCNRRRRRSKGAQLIEFTLNFMPFLAMIMLVLNTAWAIFAEATLQQAVRIAVRQGVTLTSSQVGASNLTATVKSVVQQHAVGLLNGSTGLSKIKVNYYDQNNPSVDVSAQAWGNSGGNIMKVSVNNFSLAPLIVRLFRLSDNPDNNPLIITVNSADVIEPISDSNRAPIGPAP